MVCPAYPLAIKKFIVVWPSANAKARSGQRFSGHPLVVPENVPSANRHRNNGRIPIHSKSPVDDLPQPSSADYDFASYHSEAEISGNILRYTRTFEVKDPNLPLSKVDDLKMLYRIIASDERNTAVLKPAGMP